MYKWGEGMGCAPQCSALLGQESFRFPGAEVTGNCEPTDLGVRNSTLSSMYS